MIQETLKKVVNSKNLSEREAQETMEYIMKGSATNAQIGAFITALCIKRETVEEIIGFVRAMRAKATPIKVEDPCAIDTCGTGGDGKHTLNVSTISAFVAAGAGVTVAKHGNRSVSSKCGSADILSSLGVNIDISPPEIEACLSDVGIGFLFAPALHKAMKYAIGPRREIGIRTVFNILGPLTNPAQVKRQIIGVFDKSMTEPFAHVLNGLGSERAFIVHGDDGVDEISISGSTTITELHNEKVNTYTISPEDFGFQRRHISEIVCNDLEKSKAMALSILKGEKGAGRDIVLMNAGAAIAASDPLISIESGIRKARDSLDSGQAMKKVKELIRVTNSNN